MLDMAQAGIAHIAAHTNLDAAQGGVNDTLMKVMGAQNVRGEGFVRASYCYSHNHLKEALKRIGEFLDELPGYRK